jgi:indolepyruvate ferredoxin oxidoreductase beta subunit
MRLEKDPLNLIICGVGGQGNILASQIIASAGIKDGFYVIIGETYGASQRGGAVMSHLRLSDEMQQGPLIPEGLSDIILGFEPVETLRTIHSFGNPKTKVIINPRPIYPIEVLSGRIEYPQVEEVIDAIKKLVEVVKVVEATKIAKGMGETMVQNMVMVGCLAGSGWIPIRIDSFEEAIRDVFPGKELNSKAFKAGVERIMDIVDSDMDI